MRRYLVAFLTASALLLGCGGGGDDEETGGDSASSAPVVLASAEGVAILSGSGLRPVVSTPAAVAYAVGGSVVFQEMIDPDRQSFPPLGSGPVQVWSEGRVVPLPIGSPMPTVELLDAGMVAGVPVALVAERTQNGPDDTFEELLGIDLASGTRQTIIRRPAWESGHLAARLLPDGDVVGLVQSESHLGLARWSPGRDEAVWTVPAGVDSQPDLTVRGDDIGLVESYRDADRDLTLVVTLTTKDLRTGKPGSTDRFDVTDTQGTLNNALSCRDWRSHDELVCAHSGGLPVVVSTGGTYFTLPGTARGAVPTAGRPGKAATP